MPQLESFLGLWELDAGRSHYEWGEPPASGTYEIVADGDLLTFNMDWMDGAGEPHTLSYSERCDGQFHPYPVEAVADELCLRLTATALTSEARKGGQTVLSATRELVGDQQMKVSMSGQRPDGEPYANLSWYVRQTGG
jgi:hypothetical protein